MTALVNAFTPLGSERRQLLVSAALPPLSLAGSERASQRKSRYREPPPPLPAPPPPTPSLLTAARADCTAEGNKLGSFERRQLLPVAAKTDGLLMFFRAGRKIDKVASAELR